MKDLKLMRQLVGGVATLRGHYTHRTEGKGGVVGALLRAVRRIQDLGTVRCSGPGADPGAGPEQETYVR
jgi:hypothetical protein